MRALHLHRTIHGKLLLAGVLWFLGYGITELSVDEDPNRFHDPSERAVAADAVYLAGLTCGMGIPALEPLFPVTRAERVTLDPDHCPDRIGSPGLWDYHVTVRSYILFGVPVRSVEASCGGNWVVC